MRQNKFIFPIAIAVGIGASMSVALHDIAVGWAIGIAIGLLAYANSQRNNAPKEKQ